MLLDLDAGRGEKVGARCGKRPRDIDSPLVHDRSFRSDARRIGDPVHARPPVRRLLDELGRDVVQWCEDEPALPHPRVRHLEVGIGDDGVADEEDVDIESARSPPLHADALRRVLEPMREREELVRRERGLERDDGVEKPALLRTSDGIGLVDGGDRDHGHVVDGRERVDGVLQMLGAFTQVRSEREVRAHHRRHRWMRTATWSTCASTGGSSLRTSTTTPTTRGSVRHASAMRCASRSSSW